MIRAVTNISSVKQFVAHSLSHRRYVQCICPFSTSQPRRFASSIRGPGPQGFENVPDVQNGDAGAMSNDHTARLLTRTGAWAAATVSISCPLFFSDPGLLGLSVWGFATPFQALFTTSTFVVPVLTLVYLSEPSLRRAFPVAVSGGVLIGCSCASLVWGSSLDFSDLLCSLIAASSLGPALLGVELGSRLPLTPNNHQSGPISPPLSPWQLFLFISMAMAGVQSVLTPSKPKPAPEDRSRNARRKNLSLLEPDALSDFVARGIAYAVLSGVGSAWWATQIRLGASPLSAAAVALYLGGFAASEMLKSSER